MADAKESMKVVIEPEDWLSKNRKKKTEEELKNIITDTNVWLKPETKEFTIKPNGFKEVYFTVEVPVDAKGEVGAMIFFKRSFSFSSSRTSGSTR